MSIHKQAYLVKAANNLLRYKTRQTLLTHPFRTDQTVVGTTSTLLYHAWVPIYGHIGVDGIRGLVVRLRCKTSSGTGTFTVVSSSTPPTGASTTAFSYPAGSQTVSFATTSTSFVWSGELALSVAGMHAQASSGEPGAATSLTIGVPGTWISVYAVASGGGITATLNSVQVAEAES